MNKQLSLITWFSIIVSVLSVVFLAIAINIANIYFFWGSVMFLLVFPIFVFTLANKVARTDKWIVKHTILQSIFFTWVLDFLAAWGAISYVNEVSFFKSKSVSVSISISILIIVVISFIVLVVKMKEMKMKEEK